MIVPLSEKLIAAHVGGPMWTIGGHPLLVPNGRDVTAIVLERALSLVAGPPPWPMEVRHDGVTIELLLEGDGTVVAAPQTALTPPVRRWLHAAPPPAPLRERGATITDRTSPTMPGFHLLSAHVGSGASTWAQLMQVHETTADERPEAPIVVVARTTLAGVDAAKGYTSGASAVLLVADAAGRPPGPVVRAIRVLEGATPVVRAPWVPALRGMVTVPESTKTRRVAARVAAAVENRRKS